MALGAVALLAVHLTLQTDWARGKARRLLEGQLASRLGRSVAIDAVGFRLLPLEVAVTGLRVAGERPEDPEFLRVARLGVQAEVTGILRPRLNLRSVELDEPQLHLEFFEGGGDNLPRWRRKPRAAGQEPRVRVEIGALTVRDGWVEIGQRRIPLELRAGALTGTFRGLRGNRLEGILEGTDVQVVLPQARPYRVSVSLRGTYAKGRADLSSALIWSPEVRATLMGTALWRAERKATVEVRALGSAELFSTLGYLEDRVSGTFQFDGGMVWRPESWGVRGRVEAPELDFFDRRLRSLRGALTGDRETVRLVIDRVNYGGGMLSGPVTVDLSAEGRPTEVDLRLEGLSLGRLLHDQGVPLRGVEARVDGSLNYRFLAGGVERGQGWAELTASEDPRLGGLFQLAGEAPLIVQDGVVSSAAIRLQSDVHDVLLNGHYDLSRRRGEFRYRVETQEVATLVAALPLVESGAPPPLWMPTSGVGSAEGQLRIDPSGVAVEVDLDLHDFVAPGMTAERLQGAFSVTPALVENLRLELSRPTGALLVAGAVPLGSAASGSEGLPLRLTVDAARWPIEEVWPWVGVEWPLEGSVSGSLELSGAPHAPNDVQGVFRGQLAEAVLSSIPLDTVEAELTFDSTTLQVAALRLNAPAGAVDAQGTVQLQDQALDLAIQSEWLDLSREPFSGFTPGRLGGRVQVTGRISGAMENPNIQIELQSRGVTIGGEQVEFTADAAAEGARITASWANGQVAVAGDLLGLLDVSGGGRLTAEAAELEIDLQSRRLGDLVQLLSEETIAGVEGSLAGRLTYSGAPTEEARVELRLDQLKATHRGHLLENLEPIIARWEEQGVRIESLYLGEPNTEDEIFLAGQVGLGQGAAIDLRLQSSVSADWLELLLPDFDFHGSVNLLGTVGGSLEDPWLDGQADWLDGSLIGAQLPSSLEEVHGTFLFYPERVVVDEFTAASGGGQLRAGGSVLLGRDDQALSYRLQLSGTELTARYPEGWRLLGDAELQLVSLGEGRQLSGLVTLTSAEYLRDVEIGLNQLLQSFFARQRLEAGETDEVLAETSLNVVVQGPQALRVSNNVASLTGGLELLLRGTLARPQVFGTVELESGGTLLYAGNEYTVERGLLSFVDPNEIDPVIDLVARAELREFDVRLNLSGTLDRLEAGFQADPPLADLEILSLLTTGERMEPGSSGATTARRTVSSEVGAEEFLYGQAASVVSERVNKLFGLDKFRIDPLTSLSGSLSSARVTVGKRLSRDLFVTYSYDPTETGEQILQIEWQVSRGLVLVLTQNGDGTFAADTRWEKRF